MKYKLYHGDCIEVMRTLPDQSIDVVLCDIPFGVVNRESNGLRNLDKGKADKLTFSLVDALQECDRLTKNTIHIFCGTEQISMIRGYFPDYSTRVFVWEKTNPSPLNCEHMWLSSIELSVYIRKKGAIFNGFYLSPVYKSPTTINPIHPTQKPVELMEYLIKTYTNEGETVLDFTMGSGSTGVAAMRTNRKFIGIELNLEYYNIATTRIRNAAGEFVPTEKEKETSQMSLL
jgi:DNA modification methylase